MSAKKYGAEEPKRSLTPGGLLRPWRAPQPPWGRPVAGERRGDAPNLAGAAGAPRRGRKSPGNHSSGQGTHGGRGHGGKALAGAGGVTGFLQPALEELRASPRLGCVWKVALKSSLPAPATLKHSPGACWADVMARPGGLVWRDVGTFVMADL